jgi:AcrR family transcriptional regulator
MARARAQLDSSAIAAAFAPDGLHGVSAAEVARRAGVAKPTLYAHGRSKDAVFLACVEAETERLLDRLYEAEVRTRDLSARQRIAGVAQAVIEHGRDHPAAARLLHVTARHTSSTVAADVDAALARIHARVAALLRREMDPERLELITTALLGAAAALSTSGARALDAATQTLADAFAATLPPETASRPGGEIQTIDVY